VSLKVRLHTFLNEIYSYLLAAGAAPKLNSELDDQTAVSPANVNLECKMNLGEPECDVRWFRDGKEIYKNKKYEMKTSEEGVTLVVNNSEPLDSGCYKCEASNKLGSVKTQCNLTVCSMYIPRHFLLIFIVLAISLHYISVFDDEYVFN